MVLIPTLLVMPAWSCTQALRGLRLWRWSWWWSLESWVLQRNPQIPKKNGNVLNCKFPSLLAIFPCFSLKIDRALGAHATRQGHASIQLGILVILVFAVAKGGNGILATNIWDNIWKSRAILPGLLGWCCFLDITWEYHGICWDISNKNNDTIWLFNVANHF